MPAGFWDHFFDNDRRQRDDLHDLEVSNISLAGDIHQLRAHVLTLQRQLHDTTILISVLMRMLDEAKVVDTKVLRYRMEAEMEALEAARNPGPTTAVADPIPEPPPSTPTVCSRCGKTVPAHQTTITESGVVCDGCAR